MSGKGRKPLPTQLKITRGTLQPSRTNHAEPTPGSIELSAPDWLSERGRDAFNELSRLLHGQRVLTEMDEMALTLLCDQWSIYRDARDFVKENGQYALSEDKMGNEVYTNYPQMKTIATTYNSIMKSLTEFGLTPSSRSRVSRADGSEEDPFESYMKTA